MPPGTKAATATLAPVAPKPTATAPLAPRVDLSGFSGYVLPDVRHILGRTGMTPEAVRTIVHEAAHATVAHFLGGTIVTLDPGPIKGHITYDYTFGTRDRIKVSLAGWLGEELVTLSDWALARPLLDGDLDFVNGCLDELGITDAAKRRTLVGTLAGEAERLLVANAKAWDALCYRLIGLVPGRRTLDGETTHRILRTADPTAVAY